MNIALPSVLLLKDGIATEIIPRQEIECCSSVNELEKLIIQVLTTHA